MEGLKTGSPATCESTCLAPPSSIIKNDARAEAIFAKDGSTPRSNRREASEERRCDLEFLAIDTGSKRAASRAMEVVWAVTSELAPPMVPARARACRSSATSRSSGESGRSCPSRVFNIVVVPARRICRSPTTLLRSKA